MASHNPCKKDDKVSKKLLIKKKGMKTIESEADRERSKSNRFANKKFKKFWFVHMHKKQKKLFNYVRLSGKYAFFMQAN